MMKEENDQRSSRPEPGAAESAGNPLPEQQPAPDSQTPPESQSPPAGESPSEAVAEVDGRPESRLAGGDEQPPESLSSADQPASAGPPSGSGSAAAVAGPAASDERETNRPLASAMLAAEARAAADDRPEPGEPPPAAVPGDKQPAAAQPSSAWRSPWLLVVLVALGLAAWQWFETRQKLAETQQELARRLADSDTSGAEIRALSKGAQDQVAGVLGRLSALEAKIGESQSQQATLEQLYQEMARNRDEWALAEVEQGVTLAAQQLQLAGNVQAAVLALQTADARLASSSRPQFVKLRKVLSGDLERLRALPQIDVTAISARLESVINALDTLPLAVDARPKESIDSVLPATEGAAEAAPQPTPDWPSVSSVEFWQRLVSAELWQRLGREVWGEVKSLIRIQRFDRDEPALLAPGQAFFLRENLKLRLLNARLALLAHDQWTFHNELKHAQSWMGRYFDASDAALQTAQGNLEQLVATEINVEMPTLNDSLSAIKTFRLGQERQ